MSAPNADVYHYFQCLNADCGERAMVDVRCSADRACDQMACPFCGVSMNYGGQAAADSDGYDARKVGAQTAPSPVPAVNLTDVLRRLVRLAWIQVGKERNPLLNQAMSGNDHEIHARFVAWNTAQVELGRALCRVVLDKADPDLRLIERALDFLDGR